MIYLVFLLLNLRLVAEGEHKIRTNHIVMERAPSWLDENRVNRVTQDIQYKLEWYIHRFPVHWYNDQGAFEKAHRLGAQAIAVTTQRKGKLSIHLGPKITTKNFDAVFGHELVHLIFRQKYKGAIPRWLEEGFANHLAERGKVDYKWLAERPFPEDVRSLTHPFSGSKEKIKYHYRASQALVEMLEDRCDLENLIRLSVQRKMETFIRTYCEIKDINLEFQKWIKEKSKKKTVQKRKQKKQ